MISKSTFYQILFILTCFHCSWSQTLFQENMGSPTSTTNITGNVFENTTSLSYSNGEQSNSADVRITNASTGYSGASSGGNIFFSSTVGAYGFSIEGINASSYTSLSLQFGYRKESSTSHALFSVDYWNGSAWVVLANSETDLFNESASASAKWYLSKVLTLPLEARINGLKIRFVKTGNKAIRIDDVLLTANGTPIDTPSSSSDIVFNPSSSTSSNTNINYLNYQADVITSTTNSVGVMGFYLRDGGVSLNDNDSLVTELTEITFNVTNSTNIRSARLFVGNSPRGVTVPVNGASTITFTGLTNIIAADNDQLAINLRVTFNEVVTDNEQVQFTVSSATASSTGSKFSIANAGGASSSITGDINRIEVIASKLEFSQQPPDSIFGGTSIKMNPSPEVSAVDSLENLDLDFTSSINLTSAEFLFPPVNVTAIEGVAIFNINNLNPFIIGSDFFLTASSSYLPQINSQSFNIVETLNVGMIDFTQTNCATGDYNLITNGNFEQFNSLPNDLGQIIKACGWYPILGATPDYYHIAAPTFSVSIPCNFFGVQSCNNNQGNAYAGIYGNHVGGEILFTKLSSPLVSGVNYQLSFNVSLAEGVSSSSKSLQAYLSTTQLTPNPLLPINNPQMLFSSNVTSTITDGWETLVFDFTASGGEEYIYLGTIQNQISQANSPTYMPNCPYSNYNGQPSNLGSSYYYLDNVRLVAVDNIVLDLPDTICNTANIINLSDYLSITPSNGEFTGIGVGFNSGIYSFNAASVVSGTYIINYSFTNDIGDLITISDDITVVSSGIVTDFDYLSNLTLCENGVAPVLTNISANGITGVWNPPAIDTFVSNTYSFTPDSGQCSSLISFPVYILPTDSFVTNNDAFTIFSGSSLITPSVLMNDTFNGNTISTVPDIVEYSISLENPLPVFTSGGITINLDGTFTIDPDTPDGVYTFFYTITTSCGVSNLSSVIITKANNYVTHPGKLHFQFCFNPSGYDSTSSFAVFSSLFDLGTVAGIDANSTNAIIQLQNSPLSNITPTINPDGTFSINPTLNFQGNLIDHFSFVYKIVSTTSGYESEDIICEITVSNTLLTVPDTMTFLNNGSSTITSINILSNDIKWDCFDPIPVLINDVAITQISPSNGYYSINTSTGEILINTDAPIGVYELEYLICDNDFPNNCSTGYVVIYQCDPTMAPIPGNPCYFGSRMGNQTGKYDINMLVIAPNPSNGEFELIFENEIPEDLNYEVYDIVGKQLFKNLIKKGVKSSFVNLQNYPQGMYLLHIKTGNTLIKKKLIKT
ncbi:T9SS type A sorting domain-containing protein [Flavobacterium macrobrachii]|uniref:T9SS type A sorting domain-containing protein n=1 Tax=Flavobacterium macrobrachii TaxID=591204 RepID=A0ABS2CUK1_9FLAO|nr:T9SS type A sorting domain-containing protein [Flavobacterium macrobrachii]MBM6498636.1 T9SS type A sorting domain-containing protein [Flavobacterium macrobrachii]